MQRSTYSSRYFFGLDIGTSSTKAVIVSEDGHVLAQAQRTHDVLTPAAGYYEMDMHVWWDEFRSLASELLPHFPKENLAAIGVSGMGPCVGIARADGEPLLPAVLYGVDTRSMNEVEELNSLIGTDRLLATYGSVLSTQAAGPKLLWLSRHHVKEFSRAHMLFMPSNYLVWHLTGEYVLDYHSASQCTPLFDPHHLQWDAHMWDRIAGKLRMPRLGWAGECAGVTRSGLPDIPAGVPVTFGSIDSWTDSVGAAAAHSGDLLLTYGTTMFLIATGEQAAFHPAFWGTRGVYPGQWNLAGGMATSGAITKWLCTLTGKDYGQLSAEAAESPRGSNGLLMLPYFSGERTPISDPSARGVIAGLTTKHTAGDLYRCSLEATAFAVRHNIEVMSEAGITVERIVAAGGGTTGLLWPQIVSDVAGIEQEIPRVTLGASYGCAFLAAQMAGVDVPIGQWNPPAQRITPDQQAKEIYDDFYREYRNLYPATMETAHFLAHVAH